MRIIGSRRGFEGARGGASFGINTSCTLYGIKAVGLSIRSSEVEALAGDLAQRRGTNMTEAIEHALRAELQREERKLPLAERLGALAERIRAEAGPNARDVTKEEIDDMWGQ